MATLSEIMVNLSLDMKDFNRQINDVGKKTKSIGKKMQGVGSSITKNVALPVGVAGGAVIKMGSDYEATMSKVEAITQSNAGQMDKLSNKAKDLGSTTKYSASEVAEGMTYLGMAGFDTEEILGSMGDMLSLATAGNLDLASASDIASNVMTGFGLEADQAGRMADVMAYASSNANTNVKELGDAMKPLAPMASGLGWSLEDTTSAVMALSDAGIKGEMAGSAFATSLTRLTKPSKEANTLIEELGLNFFDAEGNMKSMPDVISELEGGLQGMNAKQKNAALSTLFGAEAQKHWSTLLREGSGELAENSKALSDSKGTADKMADTMANNLQGSFKEFLSSVEGVAISLYEEFAPALKEIVEKLTGVVRWFGNLDEGTKKTIATVALVVAGIGVLITVLGSIIIFVGMVVSSIATLATAFGGIIATMSKVKTALSLVKIVGFFTSPVGIIIAAIGALIAIGILVWKNWDTIKAKAIEIWGAISQFFSDTWSSISEMASNVWGSIKEFFLNTWTSIKEGVSGFIEGLKTKFREGWNKVKEVTTSIFNGIAKFFKDWVLKILEWTPIGMFVSFIIENWDTIKETTKIIFDMIKAIIKLVFQTIMKVVKAVVDPLVSFVKKSWKSIKDSTKAIYDSIKSKISSVFKAIWSFLSPIISKIVSFVKDKWNSVKSFTSSVFNSVKSVMSSIWNSIKSVVTSVASAIWGAISDKFNSIRNTVSSIMDATFSKISSVWDSISSTVSRIAGDVWSTVKDKFDNVREAIEKPIKKAKETVKDMLEKIKGFFSGLKLKIPKPKIPKISVTKGSKSVGGVDVPYPKFDISWNAKGNIFNGASVLGGGQGVGEAGAEVVMPIQHKRYMKPFANAVADHMDDMNEQGGGNVKNEINISELVVREEADVERIARKLYEIQQRGKRQGGR